jgi:hypothetical protein
MAYIAQILDGTDFLRCLGVQEILRLFCFIRVNLKSVAKSFSSIHLH